MQASSCAYIIEPANDHCKLTIEHYDLPAGQEGAADGWQRMISGLKTWLETERLRILDMEADMATELGILTCLMIFAASMWIPYVIGITSDPSKEDAFERPADIRKPAPMGAAGTPGAFEPAGTGPTLRGAGSAGRSAGCFSALTYWTSIAFFWLRVAHAGGHISGIAKEPLRPIIFTAGWICVLIMAYAVFAAR